VVITPLLSGIAKVFAVGGLMAGAAGGIYLVAATDESDQQLPESTDSAVISASATASAELGTPTPTETTPPTAETPAAAATSTPPPTPLDEPMLIGGSVWIDARPVLGTVEALIDGKTCASAEVINSGHGPVQVFFMEVPSAAQEQGCGNHGRLVEFTVNGLPLNESVAFEEGLREPVLLTSGAPFARVTGKLIVAADDTTQIIVLPVIDGQVCGEDLAGGILGGPERGYDVVVYSDVQQPGCGTIGKTVSLELAVINDDHSEQALGISIGTTNWAPNETVSRPDWVDPNAASVE
jgi:hypothetical protein